MNGSQRISGSSNIRRMREIFLIILGTTSAMLLSCTNAPVEYAAESSGGNLHWISTEPAEIFRSKVDREAELESRGVEPPVGNASWREYWVKVIAYWTDTNAVGPHRQVVAYVDQRRRARGLSPL